ncbi:hypothetical protein SLE2022_174820 [Rubroshorea leprosula]
MPLKVLSALDAARTQYYHFKAIVIAGMGLFTDAYDLFCIPPMVQILRGLYYPNKEEIPTQVTSALVIVALVGTVIGQLVFGILGDYKGRRRVYGLSLMIMVLSSLACGFSICRTRLCVLLSLGFFRFLLGLGIVGDYPLSATIMSEFANKRTRGAFIAAVFSMQGFGILASSAVTMVICSIFQNGSHASKTYTPEAADISWRLILMMGGVPAAVTYYWRMLMPETARFTALVERDPVQAAVDIGKVLDVPLCKISEDAPMRSYPPTYSLFSKQFFRRHGRDLFSCAASWFLVDIAFYSNNLLQYRVYHNFISKDHSVYELAFQVAKLQAIVAVCSTIPGYWFTVYFIDRIGRVKIQLWGFLMMALVYFAIGIPYIHYWQHDKRNENIGFGILYGLTFFFANFGPNTTTFIVPAELFPARFRSTCHGISGAMGKVGAIIGTIGFLWATKKPSDSHDDPYADRMTWALVSLGVVCLLGAAVTYFFARETRGRSLEDNEIDNEDDGHVELSASRSVPSNQVQPRASPPLS